MAIFAGLPDDIGRNCLLRVSCTSHYRLAAVCKSWKNTVKSPLFYQDRKRSGFCQDFIVIIEEVLTSLCESGRRVILYDPLQNSREILTSIPIEFQHYSYGSHCVFVDHKLIVMGLSNKHNRDRVFVYDFSFGRWKRGADILPKGRYGFSCSVDPAKGLVYIAGGYGEISDAFDDEYEWLDAAVYNVEENSWKLLPRMNCAVEDYYSGFIDGKFCVLCQSRRSVQVYCPDTQIWTTIYDLYVAQTVAPCLAAFGRLYYFEGRDFIEYNYGEKRLSVAGSLPPNLVSQCVTVWRDRLFVWGSHSEDGTTVFYLFQPSSTSPSQEQRWTQIDTASKFSNWMYSALNS